MHPHLLQATAAAWSLHNTRRALHRAAAEEAAQIAAEALTAPSLLHSPAWGRRTALGGHSDPTPGMVATVDRPTRRNRWAEMSNRANDKTEWLADQLDGAGLGGNPITRILDALRFVQPGTAAVVARHLGDEDAWIRKALGLLPDLWPLPGTPACPACHVRMLRVQVAAPDTADWTVICTAGCLCSGDDCPCGMPIRERGVGHIWDRSSTLVAEQLARMPRRRNRSRDAGSRHQHAA